MKKQFIIFLILVFAFLLTGCEREGIFNIDDCRETISIKDGSWRTYYKTFTCAYEKTDKGDIMSGVCANIETKFMSDKCKIAYIYEKSPTKECVKNAYLNKDGSCYCLGGFILNKTGDECIKEY